MPEFTVFLTAPATIGVKIAAESVDQAEAIAERDHFGPSSYAGIDYGTWDVVTGGTEQWESEWVPQHIAAKRHAQWTKTRLALASPDTTQEQS